MENWFRTACWSQSLFKIFESKEPVLAFTCFHQQPTPDNTCRMRSLVLTCKRSWNLRWKLKRASSSNPDCIGLCCLAHFFENESHSWSHVWSWMQYDAVAHQRHCGDCYPDLQCLRCITFLAVPTSKQSSRNARSRMQLFAPMTSDNIGLCQMHMWDSGQLSLLRSPHFLSDNFLWYWVAVLHYRAMAVYG